jgi:hypothetical protein
VPVRRAGGVELMARWLKMLGTGDGRMDESVVPQVLRRVRFTKRARVRVGDKLVLYALGHDRVFAIVEAFTPLEAGEGDLPWDRWSCEVRRVLVTTYDRAPRLADLNEAGGRDLRISIRQQGHLALSDAEYERAVDALIAAGAVPDSLYRP